ncbi:MAG: hypothetical protein E6J90_30595 [Deltaproteobacteria bacterium]|nr:MAG: hypothetical protein E6J90_30595 [Deltaproteobacteria bacterium]
MRLAREARAPRRDTIGDATVAAPPRWHVEQRADRVTFTEPDRALRVTIVGNAGADAATAIAAAWQLAEPGFALAPGQPDEMPDSGDWDAVTTLPSGPAAVLRAGAATTSVLTGLPIVRSPRGDGREPSAALRRCAADQRSATRRMCLAQCPVGEVPRRRKTAAVRDALSALRLL